MPTGLVSIPNRYMHSPNEIVSLADVQNAARLLAALAESERRVDELVALTQTGVPALLAELTQLELKGRIRQTDGGGYVAVDVR